MAAAMGAFAFSGELQDSNFDMGRSDAGQGGASISSTSGYGGASAHADALSDAGGFFQGRKMQVPEPVSGIWGSTTASAADSDSDWYSMDGGRNAAISAALGEMKLGADGFADRSKTQASPEGKGHFKGGGGDISSGAGLTPAQQYMLQQALGGGSGLNMAQVQAVAQAAELAAQTVSHMHNSQQQVDQIAGLLPAMTTLQLQALQHQLQHQLQQQEAMRGISMPDAATQAVAAVAAQQAQQNEYHARQQQVNEQQRRQSLDDRSRPRGSREFTAPMRHGSVDLARIATTHGAGGGSSPAGGSPMHASATTPQAGLGGGTGVFLPLHMREQSGDADRGARRSFDRRSSRESVRQRERGGYSLDYGHGGPPVERPPRRRNGMDMGHVGRGPRERPVSLDLGHVARQAGGVVRPGSSLRGGSTITPCRESPPQEGSVHSGSSSHTDFSGGSEGDDATWEEPTAMRSRRRSLEVVSTRERMWSGADLACRSRDDSANTVDSNNLPNEWIY